MKHFLSLLLCCVWLPVCAQQITILDESLDEPIVGVAVYNESKTTSEISNFDGIIKLDNFSDTELIFFQHTSYTTISFLKKEMPTIIYLYPNERSLEEVIISASKFEQSKNEVPQTVLSIKAEDVLFTSPQTSADLLENSGQVFVQKSQLGGGSPMIRGFSTNRLLLSVDDVRMNNAIFRGGNVQNVISIDPFSIQNTEIILGAGSVIYGSDAIGGVMNFYTRKPSLSATDSLEFNLNAITRYSSASNEKTGHLDINIGSAKLAFYTSASYTDFDDLKMGKNGPNDYLRPEYAETINGQDVITVNEDPRIQKFTGYNQINLLQKVYYKPNNRINYDLGLHYTSTSDFPRYDRLIRYGNGQLYSAEWYYGPQRWFLGNFQVSKYSSLSNLYESIKFGAAYQNFQESRIDRNFNSDTRRTREENVDAFSANLDLEKSLSDKSKLFYGIEYIYNKIGSKGQQENINTGQIEDIASRYPDGSSWHSVAAYLSYKYRPNKKFTFQSGLRYNHIKIKADLSENNAFYNLPFDDANLSTGAFSGTAGISWLPNDIMHWKLNATTAFRAPNIDDVGKVFDSEPGSVVVPNVNLKSEYAYGGELGLTLNFNGNVILDFATYYTYLDNALVRRDFIYNGQSEILYDGELSNIQAIQNASKAWIYGFEVGAQISFTDFLKLTSQFSIIGGSEENESGMEIPVRHVAPAFGNTHLIWSKNAFKIDAYLIFNNELSNNQLAPSEVEKDYLYALDQNGKPYAPSWHTLNVRSQYQISKTFAVTATLENITNKRYRPYSSGISAAGTNLILSAKYSL